MATKNTKDKYILGVETTCDETSLALVKNGTDIIEEITISQAKKHAKHGGVVPELAAREHIKNLKQLAPDFFRNIKTYIPRINAVAVAAKIGLPPAVAVGESYALGLATKLQVPLLEINHVIAHIWGVWVDKDFIVKPDFPFLGLIVSGGHTILAKFETPTQYTILGQTLDDAAGETFDKVAKLLNLGYPGGPIIEKTAKQGDELAYEFPIPLKDSNDYNFSFSGLKTSVLYFVKKNKGLVPEYMQEFFVADVAASFQYTIIKALVKKVYKALKEHNLKTLVIGGGVAANQRLLDLLYQETKDLDIQIFAPHIPYAGDNASLIAGYAYNFL